MNDLLKEKLKLLPDKPGCYMYRDQNGVIIYVGKAKILKNRVKSYFTGPHNAKTTKLVSEIVDVEWITVNNPVECLVLEINLIKKHNPKYNIMLTDDKTYPYILLTSEAHPRLIVVRTKHKSKHDGKYFGPYPNVYAARKTCDLLNKLYPLRKCHHIPLKECLYYHMHQCLAPCIINQNFDYEPYRKEIIAFLNGDTKNIVDMLNDKMIKASENMEYEKAIEYRNLIEDIKQTTTHQIISTSDLDSKDVFGFYHDDNEISAHVLYVRNGSIQENYHIIFNYIGEYNDAIYDFISKFYEDDKFKPKSILVSDLEDSDLLEKELNIKVLTPQKGIKKDLIELANENAKKDFNLNHELYKNKVLKRMDTIEELGSLLNIKAPYYIEAFDNSNLFGEYPVSAMVVFRNGQKSPKEYRKYHIKTVEGANDYASMKEVVYRRYLRLALENKPFPDLVVMDGGAIQVNACLETLSSLKIYIPVIGLEKDDKHTFRAIVYQNREISLDKHTDLYLFLINISQTVHDFAISFFRSQKGKGIFSSELDGIKGVGPKKKAALLKKFQNLSNITKGSIDEFREIGINKELREEIINHLLKYDN